MRVKELMQLITDDIVEAFAIETKVDHQVKKLSGRVMFH
jgi:hypothetical protein